MFAQDDDNQGLVLGVIFGVIALVVSLVIGLGVYTKNQKTMTAPAAAPAAEAPAAAQVAQAAPAAAPAAETAAPAGNSASVVVENGVVKFYFASGKADVAPEGAQALADIAAGLKAGKAATISGFVDSSGSAAKNAELAKKRAGAVRDLLVSLGAPQDKVQLKKPDDIKAGGNAAQARRVEVTLQ
jgi:outer membrane protein OmpA-like peptidoglycan-associated protein